MPTLLPPSNLFLCLIHCMYIPYDGGSESGCTESWWWGCPTAKGPAGQGTWTPHVPKGAATSCCSPSLGSHHGRATGWVTPTVQHGCTQGFGQAVTVHFKNGANCLIFMSLAISICAVLYSMYLWFCPTTLPGPKGTWALDIVLLDSLSWMQVCRIIE